MKIIATLPTYNEAENIEEIIRHILEQDDSIHVLVIDDLSPDGTGDIVERLAEKNNRVYILHRNSPRGRGLAGIDGFKTAITMGASAVIEMDADFSHNPKHIPEMLKYIREYDIVIGSRFVQGGSEKGRSRAREIISILANTYIRTLLRFPVKDCSSGYRCFTRQILEKIDFDSFESTGPSIVSELLFHAVVYHRARIKEIPICFEDRTKGASKLNKKILLHNLFFIAKLWVKKMNYLIHQRRNTENVKQP